MNIWNIYKSNLDTSSPWYQIQFHQDNRNWDYLSYFLHICHNLKGTENNLSIEKHTECTLLYLNWENTLQCKLVRKYYPLNSNSYSESIPNSFFLKLLCKIYMKPHKKCTNYPEYLKTIQQDILHDTNLLKNITLHHTKYTTYKILQYNLNKRNDTCHIFRYFC